MTIFGSLQQVVTPPGAARGLKSPMCRAWWEAEALLPMAVFTGIEFTMKALAQRYRPQLLIFAPGDTLRISGIEL